MISFIRFALACKRVSYVSLLSIFLGTALAFSEELQKPEWAISNKGEVYRVYEVTPTTIRGYRQFPDSGERPELISNVGITFSLPRNYEENDKAVVDLVTREAYYVAGRFPDGRLFLNTIGSRRSRVVENNDSFLTAEIIPNRQVRQVDGHIVSVLAQLKDGRFLTADPPRELVHGTLISTRSEQTRVALREILDFPSLLPFFDYFAAGGAVNLNNKDARILFHIYLLARMTHRDGDPLPGELLSKVADFIHHHSISKKPDWPVIQIRTQTGRTLRLRPLSREEAAFRGCLGKDCSTQTRPMRALEPAHNYFAIEEVPFRPIGQIELIRGTVADESAIFLERFQSPKNLRTYEVAGLLHGLVQFFEREQIPFFTLKSVDAYYKGGHSLSNYTALEQRLKTALNDHFLLDSQGQVFTRDPDIYPQKDGHDPHNLVAHHAADRQMDFHRLRTGPLPTEIASLEWIPPSYPKKIKFPSQKRLRADLEMFVETLKSQNPYVSNQVWNKVLDQLWLNCEYYLD